MAWVTLLQRYLVVRFLKPFFFGLGLFALLIFLGDLFDKMPRLIRSNAPMIVILEYLWLEVPYWGIRVIPMATLLATLHAVTGFVQSGEWIAVQAAGFETRSFFRPLLALSVLVAALSFAAQESALPLCYTRAQRLWRERIFPEWEWERHDHVMLIGGPGRFITAQTFLVKEGRLLRPILDYYGPTGVSRQIDAKEGVWNPVMRRWVFRDGMQRIYGERGGMEETEFRSLISDIAIAPRALVPRSKNPDEMSIRETREYLRKAHSVGGSVREARAALHAKIAYPFSNLILCALGIPIALRLRRAHRAVSLGIALGLSFLYLWVMEMGRVLAGAGRVPPMPAAWAAHVLFGGLAWILHRRA